MFMMPSREHSFPRSVLVAVIAIPAIAALPQLARADDVDDGTPPPPLSVSRAVETGAFLPSAAAATSEGRSGLVSIMGGWARARNGGIYDAAVEGHLFGRVSLLAGASYDGPGTTATPRFELRLDALRQAQHGVDMAVSAGYIDSGFNTVPAVVFKLAVGRQIGPAYLLGNLGYGQGLEDGERSGELRLAALYPINDATHIGLDSRFQIDLERDDDEPSGETDWESRTGFVASYAWNRIVFTGNAGVTALRLRTGAPATAGPSVMAGFGTAF